MHEHQEDEATIHCVGAINLDQTIFVHQLPTPGETVIGNRLEIAAGGKGGNQALAAARAGVRTRLIGAVGNDGFAEPVLTWLKAAGVDLSQLQVVDAPTGRAMITVGTDGENTIMVHPGANQLLTPEVVHRGLHGIRAGDFVLLQQEIPWQSIIRTLEIARAAGAYSVLNIAPCLPETAEFAPMANALIANRTEFCQLLDCPPEELRAALHLWSTRCPRQSVLVTLGRDGVLWSDGKQVEEFKADVIRPVDTVGAGDTFCGYFCAALARRIVASVAIRVGMAAAGIACTRTGAQPSIPYWHDLPG